MTLRTDLLLGCCIMASMLASGAPLSALASTSDTWGTPPYLTSPASSASPAYGSRLKTVAPSSAVDVPFYSQFLDISSPTWKKRGCGIASLAMLIEYYHPGTVSVNTLLNQGITRGAYIQNAGWTHQGLALLARQYDLTGKSYDLSTQNATAAFDRFKGFLNEGPVMVSIHYKFDPKSTIPHLVVITNIVGDHMYYNDPAGKIAGKEISVSDFMRGWKKRFIVIRPEAQV